MITTNAAEGFFSDGSLSSRAIGLMIAGFAVVAAAFAVSGESLWIDEFGTVRIAEALNLSAWWAQFRGWPDSDIQMPLYHLYVFFWTRFSGLFSEYALRFSNLPLFLIAQVVVLWTFRRTRLFAVTAAVLSMSHPMVWYYLSEARPYMMMYLGSVMTCCSVAALAAEAQAEGEGTMVGYSPWVFVAGIFVLSGSSMLGVFWAGAAIVAAGALRIRGLSGLLARARGPYVTLVLLLVLLGGFYAYTLLQGARGTALYRTDIGTLLFSAYEILGLSGLGPGRLELRAEGVSAVRGWVLPLLIGTAILVPALIYGLVEARRAFGRRRFGIFLAAILLPAAAIVIAGFMLHWRVLGRHFMPLLPVVLGLYALTATRLIQASQRLRSAAVLVLLGTLAVSGVSMTGERHAKDDYRLAAQVVHQALELGQVVWWAGSRAGARHYGIPLRGTARRSDQCPLLGQGKPLGAIDIMNTNAHCLGNLPIPDLVVLSKPDAFDTRGAVSAWLESEGFALVREWPAFGAWQRKTPNVNSVTQ